MKYTIQRTSSFKKDYKLVKKRGYAIQKLAVVIAFLADGQTLPEIYSDHALTGNWSGYRECHIEPDWLLVYKRIDDKLILSLTRTGTHSDIF